MNTHLFRTTYAVLFAMVIALALADSEATAQGGSVRILASNGFRAVMETMSPTCTRSTGNVIGTQFGTSTSLMQRVNAGEAFDIAIMTSEAIDELSRGGKIIGSTRTSLGRSGIGIGVQARAPKPDIRTADALKNVLLAAKAITYAGDGASRPHIERMVAAMGIAEVMAKKTILEQGSVRAAARVESGDAELLITLVSEILPAPGIELVGPLPAEFQNYVSFAAATGTIAANPSGARAVINCLSGPGMGGMLKAKGMERP